MAKQCPYCGKPIRKNDRFCIGCGKPLISDLPKEEKEPELKKSEEKK